MSSSAGTARRTERVGPPRPLRGRKERLTALAFVLPAIVLVGVLMYYPMARAIRDSLFATSFVNPNPEFAGLRLYRQMLADPGFWQVVRNSLVWTVSVVVLQNVLGLATAGLLNQNLPLKRLTGAFLLLPWVLPGIVAAILWRFMYDPQLGLVNAILSSLGVISRNVAWLADSGTAMGAVIVAAVWKGFPFSTVIYLAALQGVDRDQVEAAQMDGANAVQRFRYVVVPSIAGIIRLNLLLTTVFTFNYFDLIWVATRGGPRGSTHIFPTKIFEIGFGEFRFGLASAYGVMAVLILATFAFLYIREIRPGRAA
jgi:multiple sugar transport system permease protein